MSLRELFQNPVVTIVKKDDITNSGYFESNLSGVAEKTIDKTRYISTIDYTDPANFARYGSAKKYYEDSINHINTTYPYDGSLKEKQEWVNSLSDLEYYLYKKEYPKVTGYVTANGSSQYITFAPRVLSASTLQDIYNSTVENTSNSFSIDPTEGMTVEFWYSGSNYLAASSRNLLNISSSNNNLKVWFFNGAMTIANDFIGDTLFATVSTGSWNHYAFSVLSESSGVKIKTYLNGEFKAEQTSTLSFSTFGNLISGSLFASIDGTNKVSGSLDEVRIWNTVRTEREIGRYWFTHVDGNTTLNNNLCLYYKFNEGKANDSTYASVVLDYSGRGNNGTVVGYTDAFRSEESAIDLSGLVSDAEEKDVVFLPIQNHDALNTYYTEKSELGQTHDDTNNMRLYKSFPSWMLEEEEATEPKHLENLSQVMAVYLDELYNKIQEITKLRETQYFDNETKIYPFYDKILSSTGFLVPDLFINSDIVERLLGRTDTNLLDQDLYTIKNKIYQNIYNNINYINKSKGTEKSLKSLMRAYGIGDNVVKLNLYGDGAEYEFKDTFTNSGVKKKTINFVKSNFTGSLYTSEHIRTITNSYASYIPFTLESQFIFPKKDLDNKLRTDVFTGTKVSLFGIHTSNEVSGDYTWNDSSGFDCIVYAQKESEESTRVKFILTSSILGIQLSSSYIDNMYDEDRWNIVVRLKSTLKDLSFSPSTFTPSYTIELYGSSYNTDIKNPYSFTASSSVMSYGGRSLTAPKHIYFGAHRTNFTGSVLTGSDIKFVNARYWADYLTDEELDYHAKDVKNQGRLNVSDYPYIAINNTVDKNDTLVASWDFDTLTGSNSSGQFTIDNSVITLNSDSSNFIYPIRNTTYNLKGDFFGASDNSFLRKYYINSTRQNQPESLNSSDMINILSEDDAEFTGTGKKPEQYFFAIEHSMYQSISDEMLNWLASVNSFNNLVGEAKNKFATQYTELKLLRNEFFKYVEEKPSVEKYIEYYKWIDSSLGFMLGQLKPATAMGVKKLAPIIESHILERNKVTYSLPYFREKNTQYEVAVTVVDNSSMNNSQVDDLTRQTVIYQDPRSFLTDDETVISTQNIQNKNFKNTYEYLQTAGKKINNRDGKDNKTVITVNFSAGDGLSDSSKHGTFAEYSSFNSLNNRAGVVKATFNVSSATTGSIYVGVNPNPVSSSKGDRYDNDFSQHAIPAKDTGFYQTSSFDYIIIPSGTILTNRFSNTIKVGDTSYIEPPVQWNKAMKHNMTVSGSFENIEVSSPYSTVIDGFANKDLTNKILTNAGNMVNGTTTALVGDDVTFYSTAKTLDSVSINKIEYMDQIFPKKDIVGLAANRTKPNYEEVAGTGSNGYDRNIGEIRSFWRDSIENRKRTGTVNNLTGSTNILNYTNLQYDEIVYPNTYDMKSLIAISTTIPYYYYRVNALNGGSEFSIYNNDFTSYQDIAWYDSGDGYMQVYRNNELLQGELASISFNDKIKNVVSQSGTNSSNKFTYSSDASFNFRVFPKIQFVNTNYYETYYYDSLRYIIPTNNSYQYDSASFKSANKSPFFDTYNDFYQSIKKYNNYSNLPEYTFNSITDEYIVSGNLDYTGSFLKKYGLETNFNISQLTESNFNSSIVNFIDNKTNKIKIKIDGVKKLLPYKGFYPSDRTLQIVGLFQKSYLQIDANKVTGSFSLDETGTPLDQQISTLIQPLFSPGILFNTIKAGIAVDFPTFLTSADNLSSNSYTTKPNFYNSGSYNTFHSTSYIIDKDFTARIPFETILDPVKMFGSNNYINETTNSNKNILFYLDPTFYSSDNFGIANGPTPAYPKFTNNNINRGFKGFDGNNSEDPRYKLAINNFLAETPSFFLKNNSLTSFISNKSEPYIFDTNKEYRMDLTISKNQNFSMFSKITGGSAFNRELAGKFQISSSLFGYPVRSYNSINSTSDTSSNTVRQSFQNAIIESSYAPYVPPYMLGDSTVTIILKPTGSSMMLEDVFKNLTFSSSYSEQTLKSFYNSATGIRSDGNYTNSPSFRNIMPIQSCLNLKSAVNDAEFEFDINQNVEKVTKTNSKWSIQTKFETPLIDYSDKFGLYNSISTRIVNGDMNNLIYNANTNAPLANSIQVYKFDFSMTGIWSSYGEIPKDGQSVQIILNDSNYKNSSVTSNSYNTGSLLEACGFQRETKSIGQLAEEKEISEAVVMIPYKTNFNKDINETFTVLKPKKNTLEKFDNKLKKLFDKKYRKDPALIPIDEVVINRLLGIDNYRTQKIENLTTIIERVNSENSIVKLMKAMVKYNLPPHLNWLEDKSIDPFVMYIFEFTHTLDKQDLADIWQGVMPKISTQHEEQEVEIEHPLNSDELFGGFTVEQLNDMNIKFKTFKIKRRANINYYKLTADSADDENFKFKFGNSQQEVVPYYSYNWPYDFFSLVELVKIEAGGVVNNTPKVLTGVQVKQAVDTGQIKVADTVLDKIGLRNNISALLSASFD